MGTTYFVTNRKSGHAKLLNYLKLDLLDLAMHLGGVGFSLAYYPAGCESLLRHDPLQRC